MKGLLFFFADVDRVSAEWRGHFSEFRLRCNRDISKTRRGRQTILFYCWKKDGHSEDRALYPPPPPAAPSHHICITINRKLVSENRGSGLVEVFLKQEPRRLCTEKWTEDSTPLNPG